MVNYPLTQTEKKIVQWGGRAITFFALSVTLLLAAVSFVSA